MTTRSMLLDIRQAGQDYEWYPTTDAMLRVVAESINAQQWRIPYRYRESLTGVLDIGAGDGRALKYFKEHCEGLDRFMAIEKSPLLAQQWPEYVFPVGCDFWAQNLIDKPARIIFCNPPYREFASWTTRIIRDGYFFACYLIIPQRWKENHEIADSIQRRGVHAESIWSGDFLDAERSARARVDIVQISHAEDSREDPFAAWFDAQFAFSEAHEFEEPAEGLRDKALVSGRNLVEVLEELYQDELARLYASYKAITALDAQTLKDMGVERGAVRAALREKIKGLKNKYWKELFDNLDKVTSRLTGKSREAILERLMAATNVDFDASNVYTVLIWVVKNANQYFDRQLVEVFKALTSKKSAIPYKSNRHFKDGSWRSMTGWDLHQGRGGRYALDYRFVCEGSYFASDWGWEADKRRTQLLQDICTIAQNLGFELTNNICELGKDWVPGEWREATFCDGVLFAAKVYKNGNMHLKFHKRLMGRLNVEAGRLLGWITSQAEAEAEMGDRAAPGAFGASFSLDMSDVKALAA